MSTIVAQICIRRDTAANFTSANPTLALGEIAYETDTRNIKVGDGATAWTALGYINPYRGGTAAAPTSNTVLGSGAGISLQSTALGNTIIGDLAGDGISTGDYNTLIGERAGRGISTGEYNVAVGSAAFNTGSGNRNVAIGQSTSLQPAAFNNTVAVGQSALALNTSSDITAVGANALDANTTGTGNTAVGKDALGANTTGASNTAVGFGAASQITTGGSNVAVGDGALNNNQTGNNNVALGSQALSATTGNFSTAVGANALRVATSAGINTAVGSSALGSLTTGSNNAAFGSGALFLNVDGSNNAAFGRGSLENTTTGSNNAALGRDAGRLRGSGTDALASADNSIFIGHDCRAAGNSQTNQIVIGQGAIGNGSNTTTIGNSSTTGTFIPAGDLILSGATQQVLVGTATAPADDIKLQVQRNADAKIAVVSPISGGVANASLILDASTQGSWVIQAGSAASAGLRFYDANAVSNNDRGRFDSSGNFRLEVGNFIVGTSGKGIDFSATAEGSGTMTSELLSDYEEGTWTPVYAPAAGSFAALTMDVVDARYTKVGRQVTVTAYIRTDNMDTTGGSSSLRINGLPFSVPANGFTAGAVAYAAGWTTYPCAVYATSGTTALTCATRATANGAIGDTAATDLQTSASADQNQLIFTITYFV